MSSGGRNPRRPQFLDKFFDDDDYPVSYLQFREAEYRVTKERREALKKIGKDVRDKCRAELDEYVNCSAETLFSMFKCKKEAEDLYKCVRLHQKDVATPEAQQRVMEERVLTGESVLKEIKL